MTDPKPKVDLHKVGAAMEEIGVAARAPGPFSVEDWTPIILWDFPNDRAVRVENTGRFLRFDQGTIDRGVGSEDDRFQAHPRAYVLVPHGQVIEFMKAVLASSDPEVLFEWEDPCEEIDPRFAYGRTLEGDELPVVKLTQTGPDEWWAERLNFQGAVPLTPEGKVRVLRETSP